MMAAPDTFPRRLWTNYFTTLANTNEQFFTFVTEDEYRDRYIESIFVGAATSGVQIKLQTMGKDYSTIDLTRFAAGDAVLHVDVVVKAKNQLVIGLTNKAGTVITNLPVVIGYRVDPSVGP